MWLRDTRRRCRRRRRRRPALRHRRLRRPRAGPLRRIDAGGGEQTGPDSAAGPRGYRAARRKPRARTQFTRPRDRRRRRSDRPRTALRRCRGHRRDRQLSFRDALVTEPSPTHTHADAVTVTAGGAVDPDALLDLLENPPAGVYRMKGMLAVRQRSSVRTFVVNVVGTAIDIRRGTPPAASRHCLVAIGLHLDTGAVRSRITDALRPAARSCWDRPPGCRARRRAG